MNAKIVLFIALALFGVYYLVNLIRATRAKAATEPPAPNALNTATGFVTNFFDTLGIGSFATTTSIWKFFKAIDDRVIPGTLNVGHTLPTIAQAFIFILVIQVDMLTLVALIIAAVLGSWLGAGVVSSWPKRKIQIGMGAALMAAALLFIIKNLDEMRGTPMIAGGEALGLSGMLLFVGIIGNFVLGALMTLGIGLYAP
ncbi:MAG: TSUP family transporter, partial [Longimicrobiales bacterium]